MLNQNKWRRAGWAMMCVLLLALCLFSLSYFMPGMPYGFRPDFYPQSVFTIFILSHIAGGIIAALSGPLQFWSYFRNNHPKIHRVLGFSYLLGVLIGGVSALVISPISQGGMAAHVGFFLLAVFWLISTGQAYFKIYQKNWQAHRQWMIRSFSFTLAFVSLRIWLLILLMTGTEFEQVYQTVAWLCWVPNIIIAELYLMRERQGSTNSLAVGAL